MCLHTTDEPGSFAGWAIDAQSFCHWLSLKQIWIFPALCFVAEVFWSPTPWQVTHCSKMKLSQNETASDSEKNWKSLPHTAGEMSGCGNSKAHWMTRKCKDNKPLRKQGIFQLEVITNTTRANSKINIFSHQKSSLLHILSLWLDYWQFRSMALIYNSTYLSSIAGLKIQLQKERVNQMQRASCQKAASY